MARLNLQENLTSPPAPAPGFCSIYFKTDNILYIKDSGGVETPIGTASGITQLTGEGTAIGPGVAALTLSNAAVIGKVLTGFVAGPNSTVLSTDSIFQAIQKLQAQVSASTASAITSLTGDVSATGPGSATATVNFVGGSSAANINSAELLANASTALNTPNTIVKRDGSGNFAASALSIHSLSSVGTSNIVQNTIKGFATQTNDILQVLKSDNTVLFKVDNAGNGTFFGNIAALNFSGSTTGTNTGDVSFSAVGTSPNANAASLAGQVITLQPADGTNPGLLSILAQSIAGIKTFLSKILISDTTQSTDKDTGSFITEGGIGVEKNINAGGTILGSNLSGSNTGDVSVTDTSSINLTLTGQNVQADVKISADSSDAGFIPVVLDIHADGLHSQVAYDIPVQIGTANFAGTGTKAAAHDHVHSHGNQTSGTLHAVVTSLVNGFMSSADKIKLDASTSANTPSTLVLRDASGNFSAGTITANLTGNVSGSAGSFTGSLLGDVTGTQGATVVSFVGGKTAAAVATSVNDTIAATSANTVSTIVKRDSSGNFSANTITANLTGNVSGSSASFTGPLVGDVIGTQSATLIAVGAVTDTKASLANKPAVTVVATTNQTLSGLPTIDGQTTTATSTILLTAQTTGSENGPWQAAAGAWTRPTWYPSGGTTQAFQFITTLVRLGATYRGTTWRMTTAGVSTIDTTSTTWVVTAIALNPSTIDGGKITATYLNRVFALTDAATIATDASLGNTFTVTLGGNRTLGAPTNPTDGQKITYRIKQDATGGRTLSFNAIFSFGSDIISVVLSTGANKTDYIGCIYNSGTTKWDVVAVSKGF